MPDELGEMPEMREMARGGRQLPEVWADMTWRDHVEPDGELSPRYVEAQEAYAAWKAEQRRARRDAVLVFVGLVVIVLIAIVWRAG